MTDFIVLSPEEREAAKEVLRENSPDNYGYGPGAALESVIAAINLMRSGDVIGTVRRHGPSYAIRRKYGWLIVHEGFCEETRQPVDPEAWALLYVPEEDL